jgi:hypothetical protein
VDFGLVGNILNESANLLAGDELEVLLMDFDFIGDEV